MVILPLYDTYKNKHDVIAKAVYEATCIRVNT